MTMKKTEKNPENGGDWFNKMQRERQNVRQKPKFAIPCPSVVYKCV